MQISKASNIALSKFAQYTQLESVGPMKAKANGAMAQSQPNTQSQRNLLIREAEDDNDGPVAGAHIMKLLLTDGRDVCVCMLA
jgi:hypothetical protein